jgi:hypothetical protein
MRRLATTAAAIMVGVTAALVVVAPAHAAVGRVYVSLPTWLGNCPNGGSVQYLQVSTWATQGSGTAADYGDDLVYISVGLNMNNTVVAQPLCYKGKETYWGPASSNVIRPARTGQTWWVGPAGVRNN